MTKSKKRERVLGFEETYMVGFRDLPGIVTKTCAHAYFEEVLMYSKFRLRESVENDTTFKQIIPYTIITSGNDVLVYERAQKGGDPRLQGLYSIGVGGHINPHDDRDKRENAVSVCSWRELDEELKFSPRIEHYDRKLKTLGFLYLEDTAVSKVHFGVIQELEYRGDVFPNSREVASIGWADKSRVVELNLEGWSKIIAEELFK